METMVIWLFAIVNQMVFVIGACDLHLLKIYMYGYSDALSQFGDDRARQLLKEFQQFVQAYYGAHRTAKGWDALIRDHAQSDEQAVEQFRELFLQFCMREERGFDLRCFLRPGNLPRQLTKLSWEACAEILCAQRDERIIPLIPEMLEWLQDMNWPGASLIADRLCKLPADVIADAAALALKRAARDGDEEWSENLKNEIAGRIGHA